MSQNYYSKNIERCKAMTRARTQELRKKMIAMLGGKCLMCGYDTDYRALQLDHVNGDGFKERKVFKSGYRGASIHDKFKSLTKDPSRYQILCANCHCIKTSESKEHLKNRF